MRSMRIIDIHVHVQPWHMLKPDVLEVWKREHTDFDKLLELADQPAKLLKLLDEQGIEKAALINYVSPDVMGFTDGVNEFVSNYCRHDPQRLIPVGSLHPKFVKDAASQMDYLIEELSVRMIKIHPPHQLFYPNEHLSGLEALAVIYEKAQEYGVPVMFHTGTSIFPKARIKYGDPIYLDDVAIDFPRLKIEESFFLLRRHANMYLEISSIPPQNLLSYFPRLEQIADKTLFGSDWPGPGVKSIKANIEKFLELPLSQENKRKILAENALKVLR